MGKLNNFVKNNSEISIAIIVILLIVTIPLSGYIGKVIGRNSQKKPIALDFETIYNIDQIFDGFKANIYNSTSGTNIYCEYDLGYYTNNYSYVGYRTGYYPNEPDNSYMEGFIIHTTSQSDCTFQDITFVLNPYNDIDYSKLNVVVYGDGDLNYCSSNIKSDFKVEFDPNVIEITILVF